MKGSHQPYAIFIILLAVLIALACIPVTDSAHTLPVLQGKAVWPNSQKTNTSIIYNLDGEWKLLFESDSESWQHVPEVAWNRGYGIYRMELYVEEASTPFELYTVNAGTNYELWINSELTGTSGTYGTSAETSKASAATRVHTIDLEKGWNTIEFRVSNFVHPRGGLWEHIKIGRYPYLSMWHERWIAFDFIIFGLLCMFAFMHFVLAVYTRNRTYFLGFALGALAAACGGILRNQFAIFALFPNLPYILVKKTQIISLFLAGGWFIWACIHTHQVTKRWQTQSIRLFHRLCVVLSGVSLLVPFHLMYWFAIIFFPLITLLMGLLMYNRVISLWSVELETNMRWKITKLFADSILTYGIIHDFLNITRGTYNIQMLPYTVFVYVSIYSMVLCKDFFTSLQRNQEAKQHIMAAWEQARKNLASDLHDGVIQLTHGLEYMAEGALQAGTYDEHLLERIQSTAQQISSELRATIDTLNPSRFESTGFSQAVESLANRIQDTYGISVHTQISLDDKEIPIHLHNTLYYSIHEAVSNAIRHARATYIEISCTLDGDKIVCYVENDGVEDKNPPKIKPGHGLDIMRYRAEAAAGSCCITLTENHCFRVEVRVKRITST